MDSFLISVISYAIFIEIMNISNKKYPMIFAVNWQLTKKLLVITTSTYNL